MHLLVMQSFWFWGLGMVQIGARNEVCNLPQCLSTIIVVMHCMPDMQFLHHCDLMSWQHLSRPFVGQPMLYFFFLSAVLKEAIKRMTASMGSLSLDAAAMLHVWISI